MASPPESTLKLSHFCLIYPFLISYICILLTLLILILIHFLQLLNLSFYLRDRDKICVASLQESTYMEPFLCLSIYPFLISYICIFLTLLSKFEIDKICLASLRSLHEAFSVCPIYPFPRELGSRDRSV